MGAIHALRIESPYKLLSILDIKIENKSNEHGYLYLKCLIDDSISFESTIKASTDDKIGVYEELDNEDNENEEGKSPANINEVNKRSSKRLFYGIVQNARTTNVDGVYYLEIEALTSSFELDIEEKSQSFQNEDMTYDELIQVIMKEYPDYTYTQIIGKGQKIGKPLFQYKETDWCFLKRIASELKAELYSDVIEINNLFYFGRPSLDSHEIEDMKVYKACKKLQVFRNIGGYDAGYHDTDYFYYEIERRELFNVGDDIDFRDKKFYVNQYSAYALKDEVIYKYKLCRKNGVWQTKLYNSKLQGVSLEGKVIDRDGEKVKLHLNIDKEQNKDEAAWFTFAPPTGDVMYCMPIIGTSARLYFPNESSEDPIVTGCVRSNGSSCQKTSDTTKRYLGTEHGSEVEMTPNALNVRGREPVSISFDDNVGVTITSHQKLTINADDDIIMKTPKNVKISSTSQLFMKKTDSPSGFSMETDIHFLSNNVIRNGRDREAFAAIDNTPPEPVKQEPPKEEKKGFNWGGLLVAAVAVVAVVASVATFGVGAVLIGAAIGACVGAGCAVASTAISDAVNGTHSSFGTYVENALKGAFTGAISGAIFGPFGGFESLGGVMAFGGINGMADSLLNQAIEGNFSLQQTLFDGIIGAATGGLLHGGGKLVSEASPFIKQAFNKVSSELSENARIAKIALSNMEKGPKPVVLGSNLGNLDEAVGRFTKEFKKVKDEIKLEPKRMDTTIEVPEFNVKPKFNNDPDLKAEYTRQVKGQEEGLNKLSIKEYLDNREAYANRLKEQKLAGKKNPSGRDPKGSTSQQRIRDEVLKDKIKEYKKQGLKLEDAKQKADEWMKTQAALHDPDQIAGGNPENVTGMGHKRINSSIGSQWKARADDVEKQIRKYIEDNNLLEEDLDKIYLNIKLSCGGK